MHPDGDLESQQAEASGSGHEKVRTDTAYRHVPSAKAHAGSPGWKSPQKRFSLGRKRRSEHEDGQYLPRHRQSSSPRSSQNGNAALTKAATMPTVNGDRRGQDAGGHRTMDASHDTSSPLHTPQKAATLSPLVSPSQPDARTIFSKLDRPDLQTMDSYVVGARSPVISPGGITVGNRGRPSLKMPALPRIGSSDDSPEDKRRSLPFVSKTRSRSRDGGTLRRPPATHEKKKQESREEKSLAQDGPLPVATGVAQEIQGSNLREVGSEQDVATARNESSRQPIAQKLSELHEKFPNLKDLQRPVLPLVHFPGQGAGTLSEFNQEAPLWSRQPYKVVYLAYFGLSIGLVFLPWFAFISVFTSMRPRRSWSWKRSTLVKLYRHGTRLTFRTHTQLSRDLTKEVPHSKTIRGKFVWVEALSDDLIRGEMRRMMEMQGLVPRKTCGFWYGERDGGGGVGQKALPDEKVVYHLHGGAYWIGTAHEKDVTAAVNMQVLKALDRIYKSRETSAAADGNRTKRCKRTFSVDYRLCVPGRPEVGSFPAPLLDALAGYRYLVRVCEFKPEDIIIAGDSAGGNLGLALCRYLRDEKIDGMPGAMILLSPWVDTSRSHSGPTACPNEFSTVFLNRKSDIISPSLAFRNTAVSALLGKMEARETYKNPYLSSCSLQLDPALGGSGPSWGYEGFPRRIYVCTGTAELNHDQHLTLAYRLASGSQERIPHFADSGDISCHNLDPFETAARLNYPRPHNHEIMTWPSAQNTPLGTPTLPPSEDQIELRLENEVCAVQSPAANNDQPGRQDASNVAGQHSVPKASEASQDLIGLEGRKLEMEDKSAPGEVNLTRTIDIQEHGKQNDTGKLQVPTQGIRKNSSASSSSSQIPRMARMSSRALVYSRDGSHSGVASSIGLVDDGAQLTPRPQTTSRRTKSNWDQSVRGESAVGSNAPTGRESAEYFAFGGEDRIVTLDVCKDGIHDYTLFNWFEPERGATWARIANWIDEQV